MFLGAGSEGLVFADSSSMYKVCLLGAALQRVPNQLQLLRQLGQRHTQDSCGSVPSDPGSANPVAGCKELPATFCVSAATSAVGPVWLLKYGPLMDGKPGPS